MEKDVTPNGQDFIAQINQIRANNPNRSVIQMGDEFWRIKARPGNASTTNHTRPSNK